MPAQIVDTIRDSTGKWLNSDIFRSEAIKFDTSQQYCTDPKGTPAWKEYWDEQLRRCKEGYQIGEHKITEHHYEYLNFTQIKIVEQSEDGDEDTATAKKKTKAPDFWDGDYDYYWSIEIAKNGLFTKYALATSQLEKEVYKELPLEQQKEDKQRVLRRLNLKVIPHPDFLDGGNHIIIGKSRRKGYSYKNAAICANTYNTIRESLTLIGAFDKKYLYPKGTMGMASAYLSFLNKHTAWGKAREYVDKQEHKKASFEERRDGISIEAGYQSEIIALTFKDNPDAARGKDPLYVLLEEAGAFPNLKAAYNATKPGLEAGRYITGQILIFGTGGDMESGTVDFAQMFYNPIEYGLMPFLNIWDENAEGTYCGFFHPVYLNMEGFYDRQGNSDIEAAKLHELSVRQKLINASTSSTTLQTRVQEHPMCPAEAFLTVSTNDFPIVELRAQLNRVIREKLHIIQGQPCYLSRKAIKDENGKERYKVVSEPDLSNTLHPIWDYKLKTKDLNGAIVIYEPPIPNAPKGLYKIGFDPYRQDNSGASQPSLASIYVYKAVLVGSYTRNQIVAQYVGRPYSADEVNRIAEMLAEHYGTEIMHENEITHVKDYFTRRKKLHLLAAQPETVIAKYIGKSSAKRIYGIHMVEKIKDAGEKYIKQWLLEERDIDEEGNILTNLHFIYDPALLEELILYNRKGNFDRVMSLMMVMFQIAEEDEDKVYGTEDRNKELEQELKDLMERQFKNTRGNLANIR
jgi:hypothetical protein